MSVNEVASGIWCKRDGRGSGFMVTLGDGTDILSGVIGLAGSSMSSASPAGPWSLYGVAGRREVDPLRHRKLFLAATSRLVEQGAHVLPGAVGSDGVVVWQARVGVEVPGAGVGVKRYVRAGVNGAVPEGGERLGRGEGVLVGDMSLDGRARMDALGHLGGCVQEDRTGRIEPSGPQGAHYAHSHREAAENGVRRQVPDSVESTRGDRVPAGLFHEREPVFHHRCRTVTSRDRTGEEVRGDDAIPCDAEAIGGSPFDRTQTEHRMEEGHREGSSRVATHATFLHPPPAQPAEVAF